jgi:undecaprenyl diphosphate synthase
MSDMPTPINRKALEIYPDHVAIILDGNGRWARSRGLSRSEGHRAGGEALTALLDYTHALPIKFISIYAFSTENWKRPRTEVSSLWSLMNEFFDRRVKDCIEKGIRITISGDIGALPLLNRNNLKRIVEKTKAGKGLTANFCINYGSQGEILSAINAIIKERVRLARSGVGHADADVERTEFESHLYTHPLPPVDLLIRPGGERRISNFLLWQSAYAELYFTDTLFPDFGENEMYEALQWFQSRNRRYGGLAEEG